MRITVTSPPMGYMRLLQDVEGFEGDEDGNKYVCGDESDLDIALLDSDSLGL